MKSLLSEEWRVKNEEFALSKRENSFLGKRLYEPSAKLKTQNSKLKIQNSFIEHESLESNEYLDRIYD